MNIIHNKQIWKGTFTYNEGYDEIDQYIVVNFKMELVFNANSFVGTSTDSESENLFDQPIKVKGFIDDEKISFTLNYPFNYYKDENGIIILNKEIKHPEIHYLGFWEDDKRSISGTWEMTTNEEKYLDGYLEEFTTGEFEMRRQ